MPSSQDDSSYLQVRLAGTTIALPASRVREVVRAVAITPIAGAPGILEGAVNLRGRLVPVVDLRRRLALPARTLDPDEFLVMVATDSRLLAIRVDEVDDLVVLDAGALVPSADLSPALRGLAGLAARPDGVLVLHDPESFVSQAEGEAIDHALEPSA